MSQQEFYFLLKFALPLLVFAVFMRWAQTMTKVRDSFWGPQVRTPDEAIEYRKSIGIY